MTLLTCIWCADMHFSLEQVMWALCVYLEAVSVLPQLRMMQNAKVVEKFTAHYVFALGLSRFISCAHWVLQARTTVLPSSLFVVHHVMGCCGISQRRTVLTQ